MASRPSVLFVCIHNAGRSQMAAGFLRDLAGLETNRLNQLVVEPTLQSTRDPNVFAIGDCAAAPWLGHTGNVPPSRT